MMIGVALAAQTDVAGWRSAARRLRLGGVGPDQVRWSVADNGDLLGAEPIPEPACGSFTAPAAMLDLAANALLHRSEGRFDLMYRILWRLKDEPDLLKIVTDDDVAQALRLQKAVWQAEHKMHAFVRFRRVDDPPTDATETYAAWFEPAHYVLEKACPFFVRRMANLRFSILTPYASAVWDGQALRIGEGADRSQVPAEDAREEDWKAYFTSVFNPARLNPKVMIQHMAKHYWRNLPEAETIPGLIEHAASRAAAMVATPPTAPSERARKTLAQRQPVTVADTDAQPETLAAIAEAVQACRRCDLWRDATQGVPGEGPATASLMFVGEQPGDLEDLRGRPFVGPAGEMFDRALAEAGIDREDCYVTNAVKHFKHELRGKRRLHKTPNGGEAKACRWWLEQERRLVKPRLIVALGATAAASVFGRPVAVMKTRGQATALPDGGEAMVTVHPSFLLRLPDEAARKAGFRDFVTDLATAKAHCGRSSTVHANGAIEPGAVSLR
jgi:probable DNA metabolism protein